MIDPTNRDIGKAVIYRDLPWTPAEDGIITSFNRRYVFVRYKGQHPSAPGQPTLRKNLTWA